MKKTKFTTIISLLILVFAFLIIGCENEDEVIPEYAGSWERKYGGDRTVIELKEKNFNWMSFFVNESGDEYLHCNSIGNIIIDNDSIFFICNKIITDTIFNPEHDLVEFNRGTDEFEERFGEGVSSFKFEVGNDKLILYYNRISEDRVFNRIR